MMGDLAMMGGCAGISLRLWDAKPRLHDISLLSTYRTDSAVDAIESGLRKEEHYSTTLKALRVGRGGAS